MAERGSTRDPLARAVQLLLLIAEQEEDHFSSRELARRAGMAPTSAHRAITALQELGFVRFDDKVGKYCIDDELSRLAHLIANRHGVSALAVPHLRELAEITGETVVLGVYSARRRRMMFTSQAEGAHPLRYVVPMLEWTTLKLAASGLAILACLPEDECLAAIEAEDGGPMAAYSRRALMEKLSAIRQRGYAVSHGQRIHGAVGIAAPVFGALGQVLGDVVVTIPESRFHEDDEHTLGQQAIHCADTISHAIGAGAPQRRAAAANE